MQKPPSAKTHILPEHAGTPDTLHFFMFVKATRHWLNLEVKQRRAFLDERILPLLRRRPEVKTRWFEPEAFSARVSDVLLWETKDLSAWAWLCDELRDTQFWDHYFEVVEILPSFEANYLA